jgi:hypothetical protein
MDRAKRSEGRTDVRRQKEGELRRSRTASSLVLGKAWEVDQEEANR